MAFRRDSGSGRLKQLPGQDGCLTAIATAGCRHINSPNPTTYAYDISVSLDGRSLYLSRAGALLVFARDASPGALRRHPDAPPALTTAGGTALRPPATSLNSHSASSSTSMAPSPHRTRRVRARPAQWRPHRAA